MINLVRVDDRLLHGQIICSWVPFVDADTLVIASDEAAGDELTREIITSCAHEHLSVRVTGVDEVAGELVSGGGGGDERTILIFGDLRDAMRVYEGGLRFTRINIGNVHHGDGGRELSPSVILNREDEAILKRFAEMGVDIDIRDVPTSDPAEFRPEETGA